MTTTYDYDYDWARSDQLVYQDLRNIDLDLIYLWDFSIEEATHNNLQIVSEFDNLWSLAIEEIRENTRGPYPNDRDYTWDEFDHDMDDELTLEWKYMNQHMSQYYERNLSFDNDQ